MDFVVRTTGQSGNIAWIAFPDERGLRTLGTRRMAELFKSEEDASTAIVQIQQAFLATGMIFSLESAAEGAILYADARRLAEQRASHG